MYTDRLAHNPLFRSHSHCWNVTDLVRIAQGPDPAAAGIRVKDTVHQGSVYQVVTYEKTPSMAPEVTDAVGLARSMIMCGGKLVCVSPPRAASAEVFQAEFPVSAAALTDDVLVAEELVEGTMINVFWDSNEARWTLATRSTVGAELGFFQPTGRAFKDLFEDARKVAGLDLELLNRDLCYSFVLQHPENRIVNAFEKPELVICGIFRIMCDEEADQWFVESHPLTAFQSGAVRMANVRAPYRYAFSSYESLRARFADATTPVHIAGVVVKNTITGARMKLRNPAYETLRNLRGNEPKLQFHYLCLRQEGKLQEYLAQFPEHRAAFNAYRENVTEFEDALYEMYVLVHIRRHMGMPDVAHQYRPHVGALHHRFLEKLRPMGKRVTRAEVHAYVNGLLPARLMYALNYHLRSDGERPDRKKDAVP